MNTNGQRPRFAEERQSEIAQRLREAGRVEVAALAVHYGVSEDSIRRDLRQLAARGMVQKTHGGAVALHVNALPMAARGDVRAASKRAIAAAAARRVAPHQSLFIDAGSTALALAERLAGTDGPRPLTVITAALDVACCLSHAPGVRLVMTGGPWSAETRAFCEAGADTVVRAHRADWAFLGACAVDERLGLSSAHAGDAQVKRAMLESARQRVLLVDASKFGLVEPYAVASLAQVDVVVTDAAPEWLHGAGPAVEHVEQVELQPRQTTA